VIDVIPVSASQCSMCSGENCRTPVRCGVGTQLTTISVQMTQAACSSSR
jgi:hypothetical protein